MSGSADHATNYIQTFDLSYDFLTSDLHQFFILDEKYTLLYNNSILTQAIQIFIFPNICLTSKPNPIITIVDILT